jgi:hypothetical protein
MEPPNHRIFSFIVLAHEIVFPKKNVNNKLPSLVDILFSHNFARSRPLSSANTQMVCDELSPSPKTRTFTGNVMAATNLNEKSLQTFSNVLLSS